MPTSRPPLIHWLSPFAAILVDRSYGPTFLRDKLGFANKHLAGGSEPAQALGTFGLSCATCSTSATATALRQPARPRPNSRRCRLMRWKKTRTLEVRDALIALSPHSPHVSNDFGLCIPPRRDGFPPFVDMRSHSR